ncbi:hypothetical protein [Roseibium sp.]|uniref:hypothetical protein n=1 Tax=Roseibium sp. TaxID=1936156 RepID=UPI003267C5B8
MTQDPTLFTAIEWVLLAMAGLVSLMLLAFFHRAGPGSPFSERDERWTGQATNGTCPAGPPNGADSRCRPANAEDMAD